MIGIARTDLETASTIQTIPRVDESPGFHARKVDDVHLGTDDDTVSAVITTLGVAFRHALRPAPIQGITIVMLAAFAGLAAEGMIVDTDHWRHFYVVMGVLWGLIMARETFGPSSVVPGRR